METFRSPHTIRTKKQMRAIAAILCTAGNMMLADNASARELIQTGIASFYNAGSQLTAAHRTLPKGTRVLVVNISNGEEVCVRINDYGPAKRLKERVIDLSVPAARAIGLRDQGLTGVNIYKSPSCS
jgi:rare lipoprotein A (peptidoglycan hydrolase)